jgi:methylenetetrahydrofolate reductase (NADPH)
MTAQAPNLANLKDLSGPIARAGRTPHADLKVCFEFFPPKTMEAQATLWGAIARLAPLGPAFVSVTYGAGGSTRERTHRTIRRILEETDIQPAAHVTCVAAARGEIDEVLESYWDAGVRHVVALRGDPPGGLGGDYVPPTDGYRNATELTQAAARLRPFEISVACYPEKHPESASIDHDIEVLKAKIDAGATRAISQFFFDVEAFLRFHDQVRAAGITIPIVPGIMPVTSFNGLQKMAGACGASLPPWLATLFEGLDKDADTRRLISASVTSEMCARLQEEGFSDFHFYTLNRADLVYAICRVLGLREKEIQS